MSDIHRYSAGAQRELTELFPAAGCAGDDELSAYAMQAGSELLIVLELPSDSSEAAIEHLRLWTWGMCSAGVFLPHWDGYSNIINFSGALHLDGTGLKWILATNIAAETYSHSTAARRVQSAWEEACPSQTAQTFIGRMGVIERLHAYHAEGGKFLQHATSEALGVPSIKKISFVEHSALAPAPTTYSVPLLGSARLGKPTRLFSSDRIPRWADRRIWIAFPTGSFGFQTFNDMGVLKAHYFYTRGGGIHVSDAPLNAWSGIGNLREKLAELAPKDSHVTPLIGTDGMSFESSEALFEAIFEGAVAYTPLAPLFVSKQ